MRAAGAGIRHCGGGVVRSLRCVFNDFRDAYVVMSANVAMSLFLYNTLLLSLNVISTLKFLKPGILLLTLYYLHS